MPAYVRLGVMALLLALTSACASSYDYRNIKPKWTMTNAPRPVPVPKAKPASSRATVAWTGAPRRATAVPATYQKAAWQPKAKQASDYVVGKGDTVYAIARRHGVEPKRLIALNGLRAPYALGIGQRLKLKAGTIAPAPKKYHVVRKGETAYAIAKRYSFDVASLMRVNRVAKPYTLSIGQKLLIPQKGYAPKVRKAAVRTDRKLLKSPDAGSAKFIWPVKGRVVSGYGPKANGLQNDGINIAAQQGAPVFASADGQVIYAGNNLRAFGNLILIRHANGYVSTYAHNQEILVPRGKWIKQGVQIATVGTTGSVSTPQVHFEIRRNGDAINPLWRLGRRQVAANSR